MLKAIPYFLQRTAEKWFENLEELFENWQAFKDAFLQQFTNNNTSITLYNCFCNIKQETSETFIAELKDKLIKKVCPHAPTDLATAIRHTKSYEMAMKKANHTKLVNLAIGETSSTAEEKIDQLTKKQQYQQPLPIQLYQTPSTQQYQVPARRLVQHNQFTSQNQFQSNNNRINPNNQLVPQNSSQQRPNHYHTQPSYLTISEKSDFQQSALFEDIFSFEFEANELPFLLNNAAANEQRAITAMYTEKNTSGNCKDILREDPRQWVDFSSASEKEYINTHNNQELKNNLHRNSKKKAFRTHEKLIAIKAGYQQLNITRKPSRNTVNRPAQTVIVTADGIKKTPVREINNFLFTIDGITIPVKVLVMNALQYQALVGNNWLLKANANLDWETQELKILYQKQYTIVSATCGTFNKQLKKAPVFEFEEEKEMPLTETYMALGLTSNWAEETKQKIFEESRR
ncbi:hypothetical protein G9A89_013168 [Geosiphon pyriformis]|nr:hypothetical protein G9A89_013168 [Geosiphon pyriformis]